METNARREEHLKRNPLIKFSVYTDTQFKVVQWLGQEIIQHLDTTDGSDSHEIMMLRCDGMSLDAADAKFLLWVFGAFEIVRTMRTAKRCFSDRVKPQLTELMGQLAPLRSVFAKQQLPNGTAIGAEGSIYTILDSPYDYLFRVDDQKISVRQLIDQFATVLGGISLADVLADQRTMYSRGGAG